MTVDESVPSPARIYDYWLGGHHNFAVDREVGRRAEEAMPTLRAAIRANRSFLRRVVTYLVGCGVDQFLDLGSGVPTMGNVHEVAWAVDPAARVVYVDLDSVAVAHGRQLLAGDSRSLVVQADLRRVDDVVGQAGSLLDFGRPVGVLMFAVLHFLPDGDRPGDLVRDYLGRVAPGSFVALSHASDDRNLPGEQSEMLADYRESTKSPFVHREPEVLAGWLDGLELVPPGITQTNEWRPDEPAERILRTYGVLARKPGGL